MRNCLSYALSMWWHHGGYLLVRRSLAWELFDVSNRPWWQFAWLVALIPHFLHKDRKGRITQYVPTRRQVAIHNKNLLRFWVSLLHFEGRVVKGDPAYLKRGYGLDENDTA